MDLAGEPDFIDEFSQLGIKCHHRSEFEGSVVGGDGVEDIHGLGQFAQLVDHLEIVPTRSSVSQSN